MTDDRIERIEQLACEKATAEFNETMKLGLGTSWKKMRDKHFANLIETEVGIAHYQRGYEDGQKVGKAQENEACARIVDPDEWMVLSAELLKKRAALIRARMTEPA